MGYTFDPYNRLILVDLDEYTIDTATQGNNTFTVNENISSSTPSDGKVFLATEGITVIGYADMTSGYNWSVQNEYLHISTQAGNEVITLSANCTDRAQVISHLNTQIQNSFYYHYKYVKFEAHPSDSKYIQLVNQSGYEGNNFGIRYYEYDSNCALATLGLSEGTYTGSSDEYLYTSWTGKTFTLSTNLSKTYTNGYAATATYHEVECLEMYSSSMDWCDETYNLGYAVPMSAEGKQPLGGGVYTDSIFSLTNNWKIKPPNGYYTMTFIGTIITDDGSYRIESPDLGVVQSVFQVSSQATVIEETQMISQLDYLYSIETGRWRIDTGTNQMIFYDIDGVTPIYTFDLKDDAGQPSSTKVFERVPA